MVSSELQILPVAGRRDMAAYIALPNRLYRGHRGFVAPLFRERSEALDEQRNPYFQHASARYWLALRDGRPVGRISAQIDRLSLEQRGDTTGHFGLLDAEDDPTVFEGLMAAAEDWLGSQGMTRCQGPFNLSINQACGLLIDGFDVAPMMMMDYAPPYGDLRLTEQGYAKAKDLLAYDCDLERAETIGQRLRARLDPEGRLNVRPIVLSRYRQELELILEIFNDAWSENWGFVPFTEAEMGHVAASMKPILSAEMVWIAELDGVPVAMLVGLPNLCEALEGLEGRLWPLGWLKLLWRLKVRGLRSARVVMMGLRRDYHGSPLGAALVPVMIESWRDSMRRRGYKRAELSWILEDNWRIRRVIEGIGGRISKTYRIYERALA